MSDEWIKITDSMPGIRQKVRVKYVSRRNTEYPFDDKISETEAVVDKGLIPYTFSGFSIHAIVFHKINEPNDFIDVIEWKPIKEKRPDFGKLNIGDKLIIDIMSNDSKGSKVIEYFGYFQGISEANMLNISINTYSFIGDCISVSRVKKITRINIDKQTFEEI